MGRLIRDHNWSTSPLGDPSNWPQSLRVATRLILGAKIPMFIWWGEHLVQLYNDGFRATIGADSHPQMLGMPGTSRIDQLWLVISPAIQSVMAGAAPVSLHDASFFVQDTTPLYLDLDFCPLDLEDTVGGVLAISRNVSDDHADDERLLSTSRRLIDLFDSAPGFVAILSTADHVFEFVNQQYRLLMGERDYIGNNVKHVVPEVEGQGFYKLLDHVYQTGETYVGKNMPMRYRAPGMTETTDVLVDFVYRPLLDSAGTVYGIFVEGTYVKADAGERDAPNLLTQREREVLGWIAMGKTAAETAIILHLSKRTCETHIYSAARKLDAANSTQTVVEAIRRGELRL